MLVSACMKDLQRLVAYEEIRQLAHRYALALDSRDLDALVALFVDDVQVGRDQFGREALRASFDSQLRRVGMSFLLVGGHVIDLIDEDRATGFVHCRAEIQDDDRMFEQRIGYDDTYERRDGRWYFVRRQHRLFYGTYPGENPLDLPPANWPQHHTGKGELPERWESWQRFWSEGGLRDEGR